MALELKLKVDSDKTSIFIFDASGIFDANDNPGGYGAPNPEIADFDTAIVEIFIPGATVGITIDVFPTLPNITDTGFGILATDLGLDVIMSGIYKIIYTVHDANTDTNYSVTCYVLLTADIECILDLEVSKIEACNLDEPNTIKVLNLNEVLMVAKDAACCGNKDRAQELINFLYNQLRCFL